jgi:ABC-type dipeptide/oligopeptide/nickel transport system ATPase component
MSRKFKPTDKIAILGRSGCGKSHLGKDAQKQFPRKIVVDTLYEYNGGDFDFVVDTRKSLIAAMSAVEQNEKFSILYRFNLKNSEEDKNADFDFICEAVYIFGNVLLVVEEIHLYSTPHFLPTWLKNLALMGRHQKVALIYTSQRAGETNKTLLSMSNYVYCGQMIDLNDQKYIGNFIGKEARALSEIPDRSFIEFNSNDPKNHKMVKNDFLKTGLEFKDKKSATIKSQTTKNKKQEK